MKRTLLVCLIMLALLPMNSVSVSGKPWTGPASQSAQGPDDSQLLERCEQAVLLLERRTKELQAQTDLTDAQARQIEAMAAQKKALEDALAQWKETARLRAEALATGDQIAAKYDEALKILKDQVQRLLKDVDRWKGLTKWAAFGGFVIGVLTTVAIIRGGG